MNTFLGKMETAELFPFPEGVLKKLCPTVALKITEFIILSLSLSLSLSVNRRTETECWYVH